MVSTATMNDSSCNQSSLISDDEYHDHADSSPESGTSGMESATVPQKQEHQRPPTVSSQQQQMCVTIESGGHTRILSLPVQALTQREQEMNQTAILLGIPPARWSGSRLYRLWKQQVEDSVAIPFVKVTLHEPTSLVAQHWAARRETLDWIHNYYLTGKLQIPETSRGYDILAAVEYFEILYQPDQCHFSSLEVYKRVQQWSRYLCHRAALTAWVVKTASNRRLAQNIAFGTSTIEDGSMELGTRVLPCLGDWEPISPGSKKSLAQIAFCLLNGRLMQSQSSAHSTSYDDSSTIFSAQEENTAAEIRHDFAVCVQDALQHQATVKCTIKPVTVRTEDNSNSSSFDSQTKSLSDHKQDFQTKASGPRLTIVNRAVLVIDWGNPGLAMNYSTEEMAHERSRSELSAPVDEYVEEDIANNRLEELVKTVDARNSLGESPSRDQRPPNQDFLSESMMEGKRKLRIGGVTWIDEQRRSSSTNFVKPKNLEVADSPDDEQKTDVVILPRTSHPYRKRKKKAVFEFELNPENNNDLMMIPEAQPVVKSPAGLLPKSLPPPALSIAIVRTGTYDNTVTSALTGPYFVDEKGILRDVFEQPPNDGWDDENTRAQARRHDWIQTALMNRGIDERVEALLKAEESGSGNKGMGNDSDETWDWLTGLGFCEFSRSVVDSVERKFALGGCRDESGDCAPRCMTFCRNKDDSFISGNGDPTSDRDTPKSRPPYVKFWVDGIADEMPNPEMVQARKHSFNAPSEEGDSHNSPRGVDCILEQVPTHCKTQLVDPTLEGADKAEETRRQKPDTSPGRKVGRGIKSFFRRRK